MLIVLDGVGAGEAPDAAQFGDSGSHTLRHVAEAVGGLRVPNLAQLGLGNITSLLGVPPAETPEAAFGIMTPASPGKDSIAGHWELAGLVLEKPFPTYPNGFPPEVIQAFEAQIGRTTLGNVPASGTQIIERFGEEHLHTGSPIVYTSVDSVFQLAAHVDVIAEDELYAMCRMARELLQGEHGVARVIARPFAGVQGAFRRTSGRRDFSLPPIGITVLDKLVHAGLEVSAIGKVGDIFAGRGITNDIRTQSNAEGIQQTLEQIKHGSERGLIFTNLVDFDTLYGHRNDPEGFAAALHEFDCALPELMAALRPTDVLIITADHGVDPTVDGTDHTREVVPLLVCGASVKPGTHLGVRQTFADVSATILHLLDLPPGRHGVPLGFSA